MNIPNEIQEQVANHHQGSIIVHAGPGSGKTATVINRTLKMIEEGIDPESIIIITFTREAAKEIQNRIDVEYPDSEVWVSTIHALGLAILKEELGNDLPYLLDEEEAYQRFHDMAESECINSSRDMYLSISNMKALMTPMKGWKSSFPYRMYVKELSDRNEMDLQDLVLLSCMLLKDEKRRKKWANRWKYVTIDEAHDCTPTEATLISRIADKNLCLILDENQSIYTWREGDSKFVSKMRPKAKRYQLPYTYRCPKEVYGMAWNLIRKHTGQEQLKCIKDNGILTIGNTSYSNVCDLVRGSAGNMILCRTQNEVGEVTDVLQEEHIPYNRRKGIFDSYEAWVVLQYAEASLGKQDAWRWVLSNPVMEDTPELRKLASKVTNRASLMGFLQEWEYTCLSDNEEGRERYHKIMKHCNRSIKDFVLTLKYGKYPTNNVRVMTMHGSKGLEDSHVILYNVNEGSMPHYKEDDISAERRLFYVAMTRAKERLTILIDPDREPSRFIHELGGNVNGL